MRPSSSSDAMASARISLSVNSLNFLSMDTSSRFVEEENRTNGRKKSPAGGNTRLPAAPRAWLCADRKHCQRRQARVLVQQKRSEIPDESAKPGILACGKDAQSQTGLPLRPCASCGKDDSSLSVPISRTGSQFPCSSVLVRSEERFAVPAASSPASGGCSPSVPR